MSAKHIVIDARIRRSSTGRYTDRLVEHLQDIDSFHRYTVLVEPDDQWKMRKKNFRTVPCPYPQFSVNPLHQLAFAWQVYSLKPDLVHFTMTQQPLLYFGNIVTTTHDLTMMRFIRRGDTAAPVYAAKMFLYRTLLKWSHAKSKKIIVPTNFVAGDLAAYQPSTADKTVVTLEASEPPLSVAASRPGSIQPKDSYLLYVGTAFPHKNLPRLIEAFDILYRSNPRLKLVLTGKKEIHYQELEQTIASHPSAKNIIITGFVSDEELKWLYHHAKAYIFPSLSEGFGLSPLEAMAHGTPVVSSDATCIPEVCGNAAHYFNALKPQDIAEKVTEVLHNPTLAEQLRTNGYVRLKKYSWKHMANQTLTVYKELLGETIDTD